MPPKKKKAKRAKKTSVKEESEPVDRKRRKDCPDCSSVNIIFDTESERLICQDCGTIFEELPSKLGKRYNEIELL